MNNTQNTILSRYGLTAAEYAAFEAVWFIGGHCDRQRIRGEILFLRSGLAAAQLSPIASGRAWTAAGNALDTCQARGWIRTLTPEDCRRDAARWENEPNRAFDTDEYQPGNVDFTDEGAQLWNRIRSEEAEANGKRVEWGVRYAWRFAGQVRVFCHDQDKLRTHVDAILSGKDTSLHSEPYQITRADGPFQLGAWWVDRFTRLRQGYRMDLYHTLEPEQV